MPRPVKSRTVRFTAGVKQYLPIGGSADPADTTPLTLDQLEALRLADLSGLPQEAAARRMRVSRATFGRILASARRTVADALIHGKRMTIGGGPCTFTERQIFYCPTCRHEHAGVLSGALRCECCDPPPLPGEP